MGGTAGQRRAEKAEREQAKKDGAASAKAKAEDDAYWAAAGDGKMTKAQLKRDAADASADAAAASRAEAKRLAKLEEEEMSAIGKPKGGKKKMTKAEIAAAEKEEARARMRARFAKEKEVKKEVSEEQYAAVVDVKNENKEDAVDASGVDAAMDALKRLSTDGGETISTNVRAAYAAFEEVELPKLKEENPRLKMSQYKEQLSKMWRKDPRNPANFQKA
jgi:hypothetical protein